MVSPVGTVNPGTKKLEKRLDLPGDGLPACGVPSHLVLEFYKPIYYV